MRGSEPRIRSRPEGIRPLHVPGGGQVRKGVGIVADEASVGLAEPVGEGAVAVAPEDVVAAVAVEVAGARPPASCWGAWRSCWRRC